MFIVEYLNKNEDSQSPINIRIKKRDSKFVIDIDKYFYGEFELEPYKQYYLVRDCRHMNFIDFNNIKLLSSEINIHYISNLIEGYFLNINTKTLNDYYVRINNYNHIELDLDVKFEEYDKLEEDIYKPTFFHKLYTPIYQLKTDNGKISNKKNYISYNKIIRFYISKYIADRGNYEKIYKKISQIDEKDLFSYFKPSKRDIDNEKLVIKSNIGIINPNTVSLNRGEAFFDLHLLNYNGEFNIDISYPLDSTHTCYNFSIL